jgi:hypothetical protein
VKIISGYSVSRTVRELFEYLEKILLLKYAKPPPRSVHGVGLVLVFRAVPDTVDEAVAYQLLRVAAENG